MENPDIVTPTGLVTCNINHGADGFPVLVPADAPES